MDSTEHYQPVPSSLSAKHTWFPNYISMKRTTVRVALMVSALLLAVLLMINSSRMFGTHPKLVPQSWMTAQTPRETRTEVAEFGELAPFSRWYSSNSQRSLFPRGMKPSSHADLPPLEISTDTLQNCAVVLATFCTVLPFAGCEDCKTRMEEQLVALKDAQYVMRDVCILLMESSVCAHFPEIGGCRTCRLMYPDGPPVPLSLKLFTLKANAE